MRLNGGWTLPLMENRGSTYIRYTIEAGGQTALTKITDTTGDDAISKFH
jgi:hypothetical protein